MGSSNFVYYPPTQTVYKIGAELKRVSDTTLAYVKCLKWFSINGKRFVKVEDTPHELFMNEYGEVTSDLGFSRDTVVIEEKNILQAL